MIYGIGKGLGSAIMIYMFFQKELEAFYVKGMMEVLGVEVTIASFFVLMAFAGAASEVLGHVSYWIRCACGAARRKKEKESKSDEPRKSQLGSNR